MRLYYCAPVAALMMAGASPAQDRGAEDPVVQELRKLQQRLEALEKRHEEDQTRIRELEKRLDGMEEADAAQDEAIDTLQSQPPAAVEPAAPASSMFDLSGGAGGGNLLNPEITVFLDTGVSISSRGENKALNRFNLREVEIDLRAAISPSADGVLVIALGEEIESERDGDVSIDHHVEIEEGYIDFHTLPYDLALKVGKFRNAFGRNNLLHTHDLPQVTRPLVVTNFFGPEGMASIGGSLSWLVPNPWDKYLEAKIELVNADGGHDPPILGGPNAENPAVLAHITFFDDITETSSFELGGSYLFAHTSDDSDFDANVFGVDAAYQWTHPDPSKFRSLLIQGEAMWSAKDIDRGVFGSHRNHSFGAYAFAQYQFHRDWYVGLRGDYSEFPDSETRGPDDYDIAISPYLSWYLNEFLRVRLEYQHRMFRLDDGSRSEEAVFLQFTGVLGAHPPHPYWVRR